MSESSGSEPSLPAPPLFFPPPALFVLSRDRGEKKFYENSHIELANFAKYELIPWARLVNGAISLETPNTNMYTHTGSSQANEGISSNRKQSTKCFAKFGKVWLLVPTWMETLQLVPLRRAKSKRHICKPVGMCRTEVSEPCERGPKDNEHPHYSFSTPSSPALPPPSPQ